MRVVHACLAACLVPSGLLGGCAFPLFNVEESGRPETLAYRPTHSTGDIDARTRTSRSDPARLRSRIGPRRSSVLDPSPRELSREGTAGACYEALRDAGVAFQRVVEATPGVRWPIRLTGPVRGVIFEQLDRDKTFAVLDCRLALSLVDWAPALRRAGVRRVFHYSMYRPGARVGGTGAISGHARGMAIDAARFELDSGVVVSVLDDWEGRERRKAPCPVRRDEGSGSRLLRRVTCAAADKQLFQVILTPHYNKAHGNHLHLERKADVDAMYVK